MTRALFIFAACILISGCKLAAHSLLGVPVPLPADAVCSVESYNRKYNINVYSQTEFGLQERRETIRRSTELANKLIPIISVGGQRLQKPPPDFTEVEQSRTLSNNLYEVSCDQRVKFEKQINDTACWAACAQYLKLRSTGKYLSQEEIIQKHQSKGVNDSSGTPQDMISTMGLFGYSFAQEDAYGVVNALAHNQPIVFGIDMPKSDTDHMVVVVGARYSFASYYVGPLKKHDFAFTSFDILDPADGKVHTVPATNFDERVLFTLYYHPTIFGIF